MKCFRTITVLVLISLTALIIHPEEKDPNVSLGLNSINAHDAYDYCRTIALPKFAGRLTGQDGYTAAAKWAATIFDQWGLKPIHEQEGFLQPYPSPYTHIENAEMRLLLLQEETESQQEAVYKDILLEPEKDFLPLLFSGSGDNSAKLVFAGWGICAPELGYDDYAGLDVDGKFVLCFRGTPDRQDDRYQKHDQHRHRMKTAKDKGALGLFYIYNDPLANPNGDWIKDFTPAIISENVADQILKEKGINSEDLRSDLQTYKRPLSFALDSKVSYRVQSKHVPDATGYNVVGFVEGSDPKLKRECIVVGGHYDHCGTHIGILFPGANDNASGSAVVMEIAEAFSKLKKKPKRSLVFALFGGEEMGLQGSTYFADNLPPQFNRLDTMFNFDMVGEGDGARAAVGVKPEELEKVLRQADETVNILRSIYIVRRVGVRSSDYAPFFQKGAACVSFSSNGPHLYYHLPGDTIYRINPDILADIARLAFLSAYIWANR
jgi:hypothetical protein